MTGGSGGYVGIGTQSPNALLTVGSALGGNTHSSTFVTNAGGLGTSSSNTLTLASIGFSHLLTPRALEYGPIALQAAPRGARPELP